MNTATGYEYDVALSFAGEDRAYVQAVAKSLQAAGARVFYDDFATIDLWGKDLVVHLDEVYRKQARHCVVFISRHYRDKIWPTHELKSAFARAVGESQAYLLPARFDETELPGLRPTVQYVDLRRLTPKQFAELILQKLELGSPRHGDSNTADTRRPKIARKSFNAYTEGRRLVQFLSDGVQERCAAEGSRDVDCTVFEREGRTCIRILLNGKTVYALDVWMGGLTGDASLAFAYQRGEPRFSSGGMNAWGTVEWSKTRDEPVLPFSGFKGFGGQDNEYTFDEVLELLWNEVCDALEDDR